MEKTGGSRLLHMQARFQQKQMQERELKIASLYEAQQARALDRVRHSPNNGTGTASNGVKAASPPPAPAVPHQPGKVRQMFEERRTKGIDKSYPLQPIHNTERAPRKPLPNGYSKVSTTKVSSERKTTKTRANVTHTERKHNKTENIVNGAGDLNHNHEPDHNHRHNHDKIDKQSSHTNGLVPSIDTLDRAENNYRLEDETFPEALAPLPTPRSPPPEPKRPPRRSPTVKSSIEKLKPQPPVVAPPRRVNSENRVTDTSKARGPMQRGANPVTRTRNVASPSKARGGTAAAGAGAGSPCAVCGRRFAPDRLARHQEICQKASSKKRKPFDALKHRLAGTEAEPFINKLRHNNNKSTTSVSKPINNNWRQKHQEFIAAIRAAKQVQAHLDAGGKLSDLPPPPPSENPDYVQCPHCQRRFNQAAAERHIPKCASYQFNKPKANARRR